MFRLDPSCSHDVPEGHFAADACVILMVDRYSGYKAMVQVKLGNVILVFCWLFHVRRDFIEVGSGWDELKPWVLAWLRLIRQLYRHQNQRLAHEPNSAEFQTADAALRLTCPPTTQPSCDGTGQSATPRTLSQDAHEPARALVGPDWCFVGDLRIPMDSKRIGTGKSRPGGGTKELLRLGLSVGRPLGGDAFFPVCDRDPLRTEPTLVAQLVPGELRRSRRKSTRRHYTVSALESLRRTSLGTSDTNHANFGQQHLLTLLSHPCGSATDHVPPPLRTLIEADSPLCETLRQRFGRRYTENNSLLLCLFALRAILSHPQ